MAAWQSTMMIRRNSKRAWRVSWILPGIVLCLAFYGSAVAQKQSGSEPASGSPAKEEQVENANDRGLHTGRQLAKESREAAGEDDTAQFKRSASVQMVAKITGLSLQNAYWLCVVFNFAVVAIVIIWASKKNLPGVFRSRTAHIQRAMEEAQRASAEANQRLADIGARLSRLDTEIAAMREAAEKEVAGEEARIKAATEEDARKIIQAAEQEIAAAAKAARRELKGYAASLAVSLATQQIKVDPASDQALVRDFAAQLVADGKSRRGDN